MKQAGRTKHAVRDHPLGRGWGLSEPAGVVSMGTRDAIIIYRGWIISEGVAFILWGTVAESWEGGLAFPEADLNQLVEFSPRLTTMV